MDALERGASRSLPRAKSLSFGPDRLPAAATLPSPRATTRAGLVDWSGTVLGPKLFAVALASTGSATRAGFVDRPRAVLRPGLLATALAPLPALTLILVLGAVLAEARGIKRED